MGSIGIWQILLVLVIVLIFFGAGRLPQVMKELARGIRSFSSELRAPSQKKSTTKKKPKTKDQ